MCLDSYSWPSGVSTFLDTLCICDDSFALPAIMETLETFAAVTEVI
jgi:hypothetical protein